MGKRKKYSAADKLKILLEVTQAEQSIPEIAAKFHVHPQTIRRWIYQIPRQTLEVLTDKAKAELEEEKKRVTYLERRNKHLAEAIKCLERIIEQFENSPRQMPWDD